MSQDRPYVNAAVEKLKEYLQAYLQMHDVKPNANGYWKCFTGLHSDSTPSAHFVPGTNSRVWWCFGCCRGGDIFNAAHWLEKLPVQGADFYKQTVPSLAKQCGVLYDPEELSDEDRERYQMMAVYKQASMILAGSLDKKDSKVHGYLKERGWTVETARTLGIGVIDDHKEFVANLVSSGWTRDFLKKADLDGFPADRKFSEHCLTFTVHDINGRPVAFASRDMRWTKEKKDQPKYINTSSISIYSKSEILYLGWNAITQPGPVTIVEGYPDAVTLWQAGVKKVVALGGTAFTCVDGFNKEHAHSNVLAENSMTDVIFCLDNDDGGRAATAKIISEYLPRMPLIGARIKTVDGADDPDTFVRARGIEAFNQLPILSPFQWRLAQSSPTEDPKSLATQMIPLILEVSSAIERHDMIKSLADKTGLPVRVLNQEVESRINKHLHSSNRKVILLGKELSNKIHTMGDPDADQLITLVSDYYDRMSSILDVREQSTPKLSYDERIRAAQETFLSTEGTPVLKLGKYKQLGSLVLPGGIPNRANTILVSGDPNAGKTAFVRNLVYEMVKNNSGKVRIVYMSLDDAFDRLVLGFVSLVTGIGQDTIENREAMSKLGDHHKMEVVKAFNALAARKSELVVRDAAEGSNLITLERYIKEARDQYSDRNPFFIIDSINKLDECRSDEVAKQGETVDRIKKLSARYGVPILGMYEVNKASNPTNPDIRALKGNFSVVYDADLVLYMQSNLSDDIHSLMKWKVPDDTGPNAWQPINELRVLKNKNTGFKSGIFLKFHTRCSKLDEMPWQEGRDILATEIKRKQELMAQYRQQRYGGGVR